MKEQLLETWQIHNRVILWVLEAIPDEALTAAGLKGRSVCAQFGHTHDVRLMWLKSAAPDLLDGLEKLDKESTGDKGALRAALDASGGGVLKLLDRAFDEGRVKGFKPHPVAFLGYLIAHEQFHQGDIGVRLTELGHPLSKKVDFGRWEWGTR
ncbi:MAG: DinB family protein [Chloroflexota bacterium]